MIPNKYEPSVIYSEKEIDILRKNMPIELFEKTFTLPNGYPIYPNIRIREHGIDYSRHISVDTYIIKKSNGVLYLWRISKNAYKILSSNNYYTDAFFFFFLEKSLKEVEILKSLVKKECLIEAEIAIDMGVIDEAANAQMEDMYGHPLFERLDKYIKSYDT